MRTGVDQGGTKIEAALFDDAGTECFRHRTATPQHDYGRTPAAVAGLVIRAESETGVAHALDPVNNIVDPQVIVLGDGPLNIVRLRENVPALLAAYAVSDHVATRIVPPRHGDSTGARAAAWRWPAGDGR